MIKATKDAPNKKVISETAERKATMDKEMEKQGTKGVQDDEDKKLAAVPSQQLTLKQVRPRAANRAGVETDTFFLSLI